MSGYPTHPYGSGAPPPQYGGTPPPNQYGQNVHGQSGGYAQPYASQPYGSAPPAYGAPPPAYGAPPPAYGGAPSAPPYGYPPPPKQQPQAVFAPGTDPEIIRCFQACDQDGSGFIDDKELQKALSTANQAFSMRTVHLLMFHFNKNSSTKIGPKEFTEMWLGLQAWRAIFERFDRDRSGKIDTMELRDALLSLGYSLSPMVLQLLLVKYDKTGQGRGIDYNNFIECSLVVKGLTDKFKEKDKNYTGSATLTYDDFMLTVLPFIVA
uniref:TSA: Wollemia nobilis Ref_Wollemi_Transcript_13593_1636 transcribed RNA sequence n=1 Tax=Wollemia nobilis TaxID=56998 RepID=A0A0C9RKK4_9CONI